MDQSIGVRSPREPWNKGKLVSQKAPLKLKDIWAIRVRLQISNRIRDLALFDLAIDSKPLGPVAHLVILLDVDAGIVRFAGFRSSAIGAPGL